MSQKNDEIQKILIEKKYLEIIFIFATIVIFLIGLIEAVLSRSINILLGTVTLSAIFLIVMKIRLNFEVSREIEEIQSRTEK